MGTQIPVMPECTQNANGPELPLILPCTHPAFRIEGVTVSAALEPAVT